ncbi:MAG: cadherin-like domain-containing protein [Lentisphaerae bacterium]|nr:cadherin-like domain-containing protein [Lentisphaerota bacterium]
MSNAKRVFLAIALALVTAHWCEALEVTNPVHSASRAGTTATVSGSFSFTGSESFALQYSLPAGWAYVEESGAASSGSKVFAYNATGNELACFFFGTPASPLTFSFDVTLPSVDASGVISGEVQYSDAQGNPQPAIAIGADLSFPIATYTLAVVDGTGDGQYATNTEVAIVADAPPADHHFDGWTTSAGGSFDDPGAASTVYTMPANGATVTATYSVNSTHPVTFGLGGHGTRTGGGELVQNVAHGTAAVAPVVEAHTGWDHTGWDADFSNVTGGLSVTALYSPWATVVSPSFDPVSGTPIPDGGLDVTLTCDTAGASIWYTTDGSTPAEAGPTSVHYTAPIHLTDDTTIKARSCKTGMTSSAALAASYELFPSDGLMLTVGKVTDLAGTEVVLPVTVSGFSTVSTFQFSVHWPTSVATYVGIEQLGVPGLAAGNFGTGEAASGTLTVSWDDPDGNTETLADGAVLFGVRLSLVGAPGASGSASIDGDPTAVEVTDANVLPVVVALASGEVAVRNTVTVSGSCIYYGDAEAVHDVTMTLTGGATDATQTAADGTYDLTVAVDADYMVTPSKASDTPLRNGVTTADISLIRRHILAIAALDAPEKLLAADVNGSDTVTTADIALIRRFVLAIVDTLPGGLWRFLPSDIVYADTRDPWGAPEARNYTDLDTDMADQDFMAIRLGDVNGSWVAPTGGRAGHDAPSTRIAGVTFDVSDELVNSGNPVSVNVSVGDFIDVTSAQFTLQWDPAVLAYASTGDYGLNGVAGGSFGTTLADSGKLTFSWDDPNAMGVTVDDATVVFSVTFDAIGAGGTSSAVALVDDPTLREVTIDFESVTFTPDDGTVEVTGPLTGAKTPDVETPVDVDEGSSQQFSVVASGGTPGYTYSWTLDGAPIDGAASADYTYTPGYDAVLHPATSASKTLVCTVTDSATRATATATWTVNVMDVDRAPSAPEVSVTLQAPTTAQSVIGSVQVHADDADYDDVTYNTVWTLIDGGTEVIGSVLHASDTQKGQTWEAAIWPLTDPYETGTYVSTPTASIGTTTVTIANTPPVAGTIADVAALKNGSKEIVLTGSDLDEDDGIDTLTFTIVTQPDHGTLTEVARGSATYTYEPVTNYTGPDSFQFEVDDGTATTAVETVQISVLSDLIPITVTGASVGRLEFGVQEGATPGADWGLDYLMPPPPNDTGEALFLGPEGDANTERLQRDVRASFDGEVWQIRAEADVGAEIGLSWDPTTLPDDHELWIWRVNDRDGTIIPDTAAPMTETTALTVPSGETRYYIIAALASTDLELGAGWNLISLPLQPLEPSVEDAFSSTNFTPDSGSRGTIYTDSIWAWDTVDAQYEAATEITPKVAYWIYVDTAGTLRISGHPVASPAVPLAQGWNSVGVIEPTSLVGHAGIFLPGWFWTPEAQVYHGLHAGDVAQPGIGFWIYATGETELVPEP